MPTEFTVGVRTECSDGYCGQLSRVLTDPATRGQHLVIKPEHRRQSDRLVPVELVDMTASDIDLAVPSWNSRSSRPRRKSTRRRQS